jgi:hypothetical protein
MRYLQACASPCNALFITRNEQVSGSSPLVGSLEPAYLSRIVADLLNDPRGASGNLLPGHEETEQPREARASEEMARQKMVGYLGTEETRSPR